MTQELRYDQLVEEALRQVVRKTLETVQEDGLPGDHHFYVTFRTEDKGVSIPDYLAEQYPDEMTIVLQHQFENLVLRDHNFSVDLYFNNVPETLTVPWQSILVFADPAVNFALQFRPLEEDGDGEEFEISDEDLEADDSGPAEVVSLDSFRDKD
jgi:hypothetical protein